MKALDKDTKFAHLGKPGTAFTKGFQRRFDIITELVDFKDKIIMDQGCGEGVWMSQFAKFTDTKNIFGSDIDPESISKVAADNPNLLTSNIKICPAEDLTFEDNKFDIVFSNEVLEHVNDDKKSVEEVLRVLKPGGKFIIFTPNRGWPFETHGMFFRGKYIWGNIPFLPWMPKFIRKKFSPHVRNYSNGDIKKLLKVNNLKPQTSNFKLTYHRHVFPAFDKLERKFGPLGKFMQRFFHWAEKTPLHFFGISHLVVVEKIDSSHS
jgi:2-polyprenyl-3-methyl-5-hydroxy-6-metoxy-1,4-benzoquinol methylase